ncbi:MAG: peptide chain release factor 1 [Myxococcales bacterium]|jgi:peptide chain release factor 1|nr:peptide chain release factor 1 [Myxococcales bacterium]
MIPVDKLESFTRRMDELDQLLCDPDVLTDPRRMNELNRERARLEPVVAAFRRWKSLARRIAEDRDALSDPELGPLVRDELPGLEAELEQLERTIHILLLPRDPNDERNTVIEIRAGTGGEEAALFAADLFRMYARYAEDVGWRVEVLSRSDATAGGYKEIIALITGTNVYSKLKFESGVHRVQRVPATETQGRVHTSTATVAILPEADDVDVELDEKELRFDIAAAGGPGGQGVNTTNSAVQVTHLPTGLIVKCQDERSQLKNKARALKILRSRLLEIEQQKQADAIRDERRTMVKAGDRSEKIRTYNFPQNRLTDHRVGLTLYRLDAVIEGDLGELIDAVVTWHQAALLERSQKDG